MTANHTPSTPFGCPTDWGRPIGGRAAPADMLRHVCNLAEKHEGPHKCRCGSKKVRVPEPVASYNEATATASKESSDGR